MVLITNKAGVALPGTIYQGMGPSLSPSTLRESPRQ